MFHKLVGRTPLPLDYDQHRKYAVLAPFLPETQEFLFEVRSSALHHQPGEVCFPGGFIENGETAEEAAIRETTEELLVDPEHISVIAPLDILISPFNIIVNPYLAELTDYQNTFSSDEVQSVFTVPFEYFLNHEPQLYYTRTTNTPEDPDAVYKLLGIESYQWREGKHPLLFYQFEDKIIWGMTARFIHNIAELYKQ